MNVPNHPAAGPGAPEGAGPAAPGAPDGPACQLAVPLGRRLVLMSDLLLGPEATGSSSALAADVALTLEHWEGPGVVIVCGNLFDARDGHVPKEPAEEVAAMAAALDAHPKLRDAIGAFTARPDSRFLVLPGWRDPLLAVPAHAARVFARTGVEVVGAIDAECTTAAGVRRVLVRAGSPGEGLGPVDTESAEARPWLAGITRLEDPTASRRFVTSRLLYRRLRRFLWVPPLVVGLAALLIHMPFVFDSLRHVVRVAGPRHALTTAYAASWGDRAIATLLAIGILLVVLAGVVALTSRGIWRALGGGNLPAPWARGAPTGKPDPAARLRVEGTVALDLARSAIAAGATGLVVGGGLVPELTHLDPGFCACPGGTTEVVREHPGRLGLPPVFVHHRQASALEIETGADLHVRLLLDDVDLPSSTRLERLVTADRIVKGFKSAADVNPAMVASWPRGASWPPTPDVAASRLHVRRVRRAAGALIFVVGLLDVLTAITPPLRERLHLIEQVIPVGVAQAAGALVALAGIGLLMLARGVLRGQRRSWLVAVALLAATTVFHIVHDAEVGTVLFALVVLVFLLVQRDAFRAEPDTRSLRSAVVVLVIGAVAATLSATAVVELSGRIKHHPLPGFPLVLLGSAERLVGLDTVGFPPHINGFVAPSMLAIGLALVFVALFLLTRPVVDRRLSSGRAAAARRAAELRARDIVRRHGTGTLDYFALRDDKQWWFHRDSLVAYAVHGGVCLVSPDPIGPISERDQVWTSFREFADHHGWAIGIMGAGEEWLPRYREDGMRHVYIGDEGVVDLRTFSLDGGKMKGLRQAVSRVARYGYTVRFVDPSEVTADEVGALVDLMKRNRRGEQERGFSMMLGRIFDPRDTGLLLTVVDDPEGRPVAMCQFVPSHAIGGYSLDLMRRDGGEHPNGLLDFALCSTIEHLRARGCRGLSLNFAAMRSILEGDTGDGLTQRVERWALKRLSGFLQIESLWRFNAKYEPGWLPRYIVFDSAEQFVPTTLQIMRVESLTEMPVIGRLLSAPARPLTAAAPGGPAARDEERHDVAAGPRR